MIVRRAALLIVLVASALTQAAAFTIQQSNQQLHVAHVPSPLQPQCMASGLSNRQLTMLHATTSKDRKRSRVSDPSGETPAEEEWNPEVTKLEDIPELQYDPDAHLPGQPWRRGETDGCEDPIDSPWRQKAEDIIVKAAELVGGEVLDCTWYLTSLVITISDDFTDFPVNPLKDSGPPIDIKQRHGPIWKDPDDPEPEPIWADDVLETPVYQRDLAAEAKKRRDRYAPKEEHEMDDEDEEEEDEENYVSPNVEFESRADDAVRVAKEYELLATKEQTPVDVEHLAINTGAISTIAGAIIEALELEEEELQVLARHELVLAAPGPEGFLETQIEFDENRDKPVIIETSDPWDSNRTLKGRLVDRNSMDIIINQQGRMVTVPLNFVASVRLANLRDDDGTATAAENEEEESDDEEEYEYEYEYEEYEEE